LPNGSSPSVSFYPMYYLHWNGSELFGLFVQAVLPRAILTLLPSSCRVSEWAKTDKDGEDFSSLLN
jgi:hypothetical protein